MSATSTTVTVDRELLVDLYVEASAIDEVLERLIGPQLTERLVHLTGVLLEEGFGIEEDAAKEKWWVKGETRADELLSRLVKGKVVKEGGVS